METRVINLSKELERMSEAFNRKCSDNDNLQVFLFNYTNSFRSKILII